MSSLFGNARPATGAPAAPPARPLSPFAGIEQIQPSRHALYVTPGQYINRLERVKNGLTQSREGFTAIEMTCMHVVDSKGGVANSAGSEPTHMLMHRHKPFHANWKHFVMQVLGIPAEYHHLVTDEMSLEITSDSNPFGGIYVAIDANEIRTQAKGQPFTQVRYLGVVTPQEARGMGLPQELLARIDAEMPALMQRIEAVRTALGLSGAPVTAPAPAAVVAPAPAPQPAPAAPPAVFARPGAAPAGAQPAKVGLFGGR